MHYITMLIFFCGSISSQCDSNIHISAAQILRINSFSYNFCYLISLKPKYSKIMNCGGTSQSLLHVFWRNKPEGAKGDTSITNCRLLYEKTNDYRLSDCIQFVVILPTNYVRFIIYLNT